MVRDKAEMIVTADNTLNPPQRTTNPSSNSSSASSQSSEEAVRKRSVEIKTTLYSATTAGANRYQGGCYLHKSQDHAFFQCQKLKKICLKLNCLRHLQDAEANLAIPPHDQESTTRSPTWNPTQAAYHNNPSNTTPLETQTAVARRAHHIERREEKLKQQ